VQKGAERRQILVADRFEFGQGHIGICESVGAARR
jgi:hypothetical protein